MKNKLNFNSSGTLLVIIAFLTWGIAPIYFKSIQMVSPLEILSHRIIWSVLFLFLIITSKNQLYKIIETFQSPRNIFTLICTAILISSNWLIFIWAILNNHLMEASFGYFISPIFNILLGLIFLKEKLNLIQIISLIITTIAIIFQFMEISFTGFTPFIPILLAGTFGFYGLLRRQVKVESMLGLTVETLLLSPIAFIYLVYLGSTQQLLFLSSIKLSLFLIFAGILTSIPLLLYIAGAKLLPLSKVGFLQYISPTVQLLIAVFVFHENINFNKTMSFCFVWFALSLYILNNILLLIQNKKIPGKV
jgi:chloramphenicol-sensitive protein RarD